MIDMCELIPWCPLICIIETLGYLQDKTGINRKILFLIVVLIGLFILSLQAGRNFIMYVA